MGKAKTRDTYDDSGDDNDNGENYEDRDAVVVDDDDDDDDDSDNNQDDDDGDCVSMILTAHKHRMIGICFLVILYCVCAREVHNTWLEKWVQQVAVSHSVNIYSWASSLCKHTNCATWNAFYSIQHKTQCLIYAIIYGNVFEKFPCYILSLIL